MDFGKHWKILINVNTKWWLLVMAKVKLKMKVVLFQVTLIRSLELKNLKIMVKQWDFVWWGILGARESGKVSGLTIHHYGHQNYANLMVVQLKMTVHSIFHFKTTWSSMNGLHMLLTLIMNTRDLWLLNLLTKKKTLHTLLLNLSKNSIRDI